MSRPIRAPQDLIDRVRSLVDATSISEAGRQLRLAEATVARLAGGLPVTEGTAVIAAQRLADAEKKAA